MPRLVQRTGESDASFHARKLARKADHLKNGLRMLTEAGIAFTNINNRILQIPCGEGRQIDFHPTTGQWTMLHWDENDSRMVSAFVGYGVHKLIRYIQGEQ